MKKSLLLIASLAVALALAGCNNGSDNSSSSDKNEGITESGIRFKGIGDKTISISADKASAARAITTDDSLKAILQENDFTQALDFIIVYKDKNISYEEFTGFAPNPENTFDSEYGNNTKYTTSGPLHKFNDYDFVWVTHPVSQNHDDYAAADWDENDTVVIIRFGDWNGEAVNIENVIGGMDWVRVTYQIGVLDDVVAELNSPRFTEWNEKALDLINSSGCYLNCYVNDEEVPSGNANRNCWGRKWTDANADNVYGVQFKIFRENMDDMDIRYACDGTIKPTWIDEDSKFLTDEKNSDGGFKNWWCASKTMLDNVPQSLRQDLSNWDEFYAAAAD